MVFHRAITAVALAAALSAAAPVAAATIYVESINGELSGDHSAPTFLSFLTGSNVLTGVTGSTAGVGDRDYFTFVIPQGHTLSAVTLLADQLTAGNAQFFGLQAGNQVTVDPAAPVATPLLGYTLLAPASINLNILPAMGTAAGAIGFVGPLAAGQYSGWIQDTNAGPSNYSLRFDVTPVPEPGTILLALTGAAALARRRRRV